MIAFVAIVVLGAIGSLGGDDPSTVADEGSGELVITSHRSGESVDTARITVRGTAPAGAVIVRDVSLGADERALADTSGAWEMTLELDEGVNSFVFRIGDDRDTERELNLAYEPTTAATTSPEATPAPEATASQVATPEPTPEATPEATPEPTPDPTPEPTPEPTPPPAASLDFEPITLKGRGDKVARFRIPEDAAAMASINYSGSGNFAVWTLDSSGDETDLLVNEIGSYKGRVLFDESGHSIAFKIEASGAWGITVNPIQKVPKWDGTEPRKGSSDDVVRLTRDTSPLATLKLSHRGAGNFAIWAYGSSGTDLLVNEIGRYSGEVLLGDAFLFEIVADGDWQMTLVE